MNWNEIKKLKNSYLEAMDQARSAKTKKTAEKYREKASEIRRKISHELAEWNFDGLDFKQLNVMAPMGGPYYTVSASDFRIEKNLGWALQISFVEGGSRWAGYVHWIDDKCGINNINLIN